ncbi:MAG: hypothetical protein KC416_09645 [Myxococcales bacterium]|nr:hypothetical protein [Myxococcales bacterium]
MSAARVLVLGAVFLGFGCSGNQIQFPTRGLDHPGDIAFVCYDVSTDEALDLEDCDGDAEVENAELHALVTQRTRGEVAVVNLEQNTLIDGNFLVPGYTFVPAGDLPTSIAIPERAPRFAYITNFGSQDVWAIPTSRFRIESAEGGAEPMKVSLGAGAADLVLSPDETKLYASLPEEGALSEIPILDDGTLGEARRVSLDATVPAAVQAGAMGLGYCVSCPVSDCEGLLGPEEADPRTPFSAGPLPRPGRLRIDALSGRLLVADESLPVIHVREADSVDTALPSLSVGVPITDFAVTPPVPDAFGDDLATSEVRYLYAIDATDGSVLVVDYGTGAVLPVETSPGKPVDRVFLSSAARTLDVIAPHYGEEECDPADADSAQAGPSRLRGVFVAVGTADSLVRIIDVYDAEAACRQCGETSLEQAFYIRRHRPRIGNRIRRSMRLFSAPSFLINALTYRVETDGTTEGELAPDFDRVECPTGMGQVYPKVEDSAEPVLCANDDPWASIAESWRLEYEGLLPQSQGGRGELTRESGTVTLQGEIDFCAVGTLGSKDASAAPAESPEASYPGDLLRITSSLPTATDGDDICKARFGEDADGTARLLPIDRAFENRVELGISENRFDEVTRCFPGFIEYEVHSGKSFTVTGSFSGLLHRVVSDGEGGACRVDASAPEHRQGRAIFDVLFDNGFLHFRLLSPNPETDRDRVLQRGDLATVSLVLTEVPAPLFDGVGPLPSRVTFGPLDDRIYVLDNSSLGFFESSADNYRMTPAFR